MSEVIVMTLENPLLGWKEGVLSESGRKQASLVSDRHLAGVRESEMGVSWSTNPSPPPIFISIRTELTQSVEQSFEKYIAGRFATIDSTLAVYLERIGETLRFYTVMEDEEDGSLDLLLNEERGLHQKFPEDELDFQVLLGAELLHAMPSALISIWQRG